MKNINRIDHVAAVVRPENLDKAVSQLSVVLQTAFYGPFERADKMRVAVSWDAGVEVIAPLTDDPEHVLMKHIEQFGEGSWTVIYGVRDLDETLDRLKKLGYEPLGRYSGLTGVEPWVDRFERIDEALLDPRQFGGISLTLATVEERRDSA